MGNLEATAATSNVDPSGTCALPSTTASSSAAALLRSATHRPLRRGLRLPGRGSGGRRGGRGRGLAAAGLADGVLEFAAKVDLKRGAQHHEGVAQSGVHTGRPLAEDGHVREVEDGPDGRVVAILLEGGHAHVDGQVLQGRNEQQEGRTHHQIEWGPRVGAVASSKRVVVEVLAAVGHDGHQCGEGEDVGVDQRFLAYSEPQQGAQQGRPTSVCHENRQAEDPAGDRAQRIKATIRREARGCLAFAVGHGGGGRGGLLPTVEQGRLLVGHGRIRAACRCGSEP
mmetsp:Transcript_119654/g.381854  ORF Transcript_119654/g.381854 Transcript_119654/m.381854 type:complete len:283 (+) Transcript_119654:214-1062(+)